MRVNGFFLKRNCVEYSAIFFLYDETLKERPEMSPRDCVVDTRLNFERRAKMDTLERTVSNEGIVLT